jgi:DNA-binding transcriptional MerR regulator
VDRATLATMLGVRLQEIQDSLQQPKEAAGKAMSLAQRAELERQQAALKRALALTDQSGWLTQEPVVVDTNLRQLLGPMATMLSAGDMTGVDRLA